MNGNMEGIVIIACAVGICVSSAVRAQVTNSMASNADWTNAAAWSLGHVPTGTETVEIQAGVTANASNTTTNDFAGDLILRPGAQIYQWSDAWIGDCLPADTNSTIYLFDGATILTRQGKNSTLTTDNPILIEGAVTLAKGTYYNAADWEIRSVISGSGNLTYSFTESSSPATGREILLRPSAANTYTGGTIVTNALGGEQVLRIYTDHALGTGDVTIKTASRVDFDGTTSNVIHDTAALYIEGTAILDLNNNNETINQLFVDGESLPGGSYTSLAADFLQGNGTLTVLSPTDDTAPLFVSMTNDVPGGTLSETNYVVNYTITFSDDYGIMDPTTVTASVFTNVGNGSVSIGPITPMSGTNFHVAVLIDSAGSLQLQILEGATITDVAGNALDTTSAIADEEIVTITPYVSPRISSTTVPTVIDSITAQNSDGDIDVIFDASGADKLVVIVTGENSNSGDINGDCYAVTYDGVNLSQAVNRSPVGSTLSATFDQTYNDIWYLDNPGQVHTNGTLFADLSKRGSLTAFALSGTAPGFGGTSISPQEFKYARVGARYAKSIIIASHGMGGNGNTANVGSVNTVSPLIEVSAQENGSLWDGHVTGYMPVEDSTDIVVPTFVGGNTVGSHTIAAEFGGLPPMGTVITVK